VRGRRAQSSAGSPLSTATENGSGRAPAGPAKFGRADWIAVFKRSGAQFMGDDCMGLAQQIAYSSLLALFPALAAVIGFLGVFHLFDNVESVLSGVAPHGVIKFVNTLRGDSKGGAKAAALVIGLLGGIWAASGAMGSVIKAVNRAYDRKETRPFWKVRGIAILLVVTTGISTALVFLLIVLGGDLGTVISRQPGVGPVFDVLWGILRWPLAFVAILLFFALVYYFAPNLDVRTWKWISPGSLVGGILWLALSGLFQLYVTYAGNYSKTYGTLATGVILLLWLNYSSFALLFGAELNSELDRQADIRAAGGPDAGLIKPARRTTATG
jgi:membrane protein